GNPFAKAALDTAWWSLHSRIENHPLHELLGAARSEVPVGADFGVTDRLDDLLDDIGRAVAAGFPRVKLKFRPGWDLPMLEAVRTRFPTQTIHIDCNSGYRIRDAALFEQVDEFDLAMIEQPLQHDDLNDHARLQSRIKTPVCLDESIVSLDHARQAVELGSCRYVNIKPGRVGGLTNAAAIHNLCREAGIPCWVGGMLESAVGASHCAALAMLDNFTYPADVFPSSRFYHEDLADPPLELHHGPGGIPSVAAPKLLPSPVPERLTRLTREKSVVQ
ncbi:MAG: o-succinylbenzoate synthase, partial [Planctomycetaceae bacterium]